MIYRIFIIPQHAFTLDKRFNNTKQINGKVNAIKCKVQLDRKQ